MAKGKKNKAKEAAADESPEQEAQEIIEEAEAKVVNIKDETQSELEKIKNDFLYLSADFDNFKKQAIKERSQTIKYGSEQVYVQILEVLDNFERALEGELSADNIDQFKTGVRMIHKELLDTLGKFGVEEIPSLGEKFDPQIHEAISAEDTKEVDSGHVLRVIKNPFKLHDKVIRPGQVIVAK